MEKELFDQIMAQQVYLLKRIEKLELKVYGSGRMIADDHTYFEELVEQGKKIRIKSSR